MLNSDDGMLLRLLMDNTDPEVSLCTIWKIGFWSLPQILSNPLSHCQILGPQTTSPGSSYDAAHHLFPTTEKLRLRNHAEISFTNYDFVLKNCARQSAGYD